MKSSKTNSLYRLLSFVLIAILLISVVSFAAAGWNKSPEPEPDSGDINSGNKNDDADENTDGNPDNEVNPPPSEDNTENTPNQDTPTEPPIEAPKYYNTLTGLEITKEELDCVPLGFVVNSALPLYGLSGSDIVLEFPTESGDTRLLAYTTNYSSLWKVGSLAPTRDFITNTSKLFGGVVVSYGNDDILKYSLTDTARLSLDLTKISGSYFVQNTYNVYTSADMVGTAIDRNMTSLITSQYKAAPYVISDTQVFGTTSAKSVIIPYSENSETELYYSEKTGEYLYFKAGSRRVDMLNGQNISFKNVFLLFADSTTYEKSDGCELVIDNTSGGSGYYISGGEKTEISWSCDETGALVFKTLDGNVLKVNKGNSYIGYFKASNSSAVTIG